MIGSDILLCQLLLCGVSAFTHASIAFPQVSLLLLIRSLHLGFLDALFPKLGLQTCVDFLSQRSWSRQSGACKCAVALKTAWDGNSFILQSAKTKVCSRSASCQPSLFAVLPAPTAALSVESWQPGCNIWSFMHSPEQSVQHLPEPWPVGGWGWKQQGTGVPQQLC